MLDKRGSNGKILPPMAVCKCVYGTAAVRYGERQRPEHRSRDLL